MNRTEVGRRGRSARRATRRLHLEALEDRTLLSVDLAAAYNGIGPSGYVPPDADAAVGPDFVVETINLQVAYYRKSDGVRDSQRSLSSFFIPLGGVLQGSDPVVTYDEYTGQFVVGMIDFGGPTVQRFDIAISNDSDPRDGWYFGRYDMNDRTGGVNWAVDYPKIGYNQDAYVISFNMFQSGGFGQHVDTLSIDKTDLTGYRVVWPTTLIQVPGMAPALMHGANPGDSMWFAGIGSAFTNIRVLHMDNVLSSSPSLSRDVVTVPIYSNAPRPTQPGGMMNWSFDTRMMNAVMSNGQLYAAHTVGAAGVAHARWYQIDTTSGSPSLIQEGDIDQGPGVHTYFPTIEVNQEGDLGMTFIESSPSEFMSIYVTGESVFDDPSVVAMQTPVQSHRGMGTYTQNRAGDYSGISVDPSDGYTFWAANEYRGNLSPFNTGIAAFGVSPSGTAPSSRFAIHAALANRANPSHVAPVEPSAQPVVSVTVPVEHQRALLDWLFLSRRSTDQDGVFIGLAPSALTESVLFKSLSQFAALWDEAVAL